MRTPLTLVALLCLFIVGCGRPEPEPPAPTMRSTVTLEPSQAACMRDYVGLCQELLIRLSVPSLGTGNPTDLRAYLTYCEPRTGSSVDQLSPCDRHCSLAAFLPGTPPPSICPNAPVAITDAEWCLWLTERTQEYLGLDAEEQKSVAVLIQSMQAAAAACNQADPETQQAPPQQ